jgi:hypothetical protein
MKLNGIGIVSHTINNTMLFTLIFAEKHGGVYYNDNDNASTTGNNTGVVPYRYIDFGPYA